MKDHLFQTLTFAFILLFTLLDTCISASEVNLPGKYTVTYFSAKDGVEDGLVNHMIQDHKGLMWFATWNGLYRFDGYSFHNYKSNTKEGEGLTNDRLLSISEDIHGYLWVLCYDSTAYRFNPDRELFESIPKSSSSNFQSIQVLTNGVVWLMSTDGSAIRAYTNPDDLTLSFQSFSVKHNTLLSGHIHSVFLDSAEREWILTDNGLYSLHHDQLTVIVPGNTDTHRQITFYTATEHAENVLFGANRGEYYIYSLADNTLTAMQLETPSAIISIHTRVANTWYITDKDGFFVAEENQQPPKHYRLDQLRPLPDKTIESAFVTRNGLLCLTHPQAGVTLFDQATEDFTLFTGKDENRKPLDTETGFFAIEDPNGVLWIHPKGGGFSYYDPLRKQLIPFNTTEQPDKWKSNDRCFSAFADKQGNLWMSTQLNRLKRITFIPDKFQFHTPSPQDMDLPENEIRALYIDRKGRIWTGSRDHNISIYDARFKLLQRFQAGKVYAIMQDEEGNYWISTKGEGLIKAVETSDCHFRLEHFTHDPDNLYSISHDYVYYTFQDRNKRIWVATYGGGLNSVENLPDGSIRFINHLNRLKNYPIQRFYKTRHITEDLNGHIWLSTTAGILQFDDGFLQPETIAFNQIFSRQGDINSLSNNDVHMIRRTRSGRIYAVTYGGGLNEIVPLSHGGYGCKPFTQKNGLISDIIYAIQEDRNGYLWLATGGGLVKFIDENEQVQYPGEHIDFNIHFSEGVGAINGDYVFFGTNRGVLYFAPDNISKTDFAPPIFFSSLWVNNKEITSKTHPDILPNSIDNIRRLTLPPHNHSLRLIFSALDMTHTEYTHYAYMLEGFDPSYRFTDNGHEANYTNLPPGEYTFHVKSTNSEGVWVDNQRSLAIEVLPAFSETIYAKVLYFLLIGLVGIIVIYIYIVFYRMKQQVKNEEYLAQLKVNFFTDVSHELRTPLTLITGPLEMILKNEVLPDHHRNLLETIKKNSERMQRLVSQILDFNKIRDNKMDLRIQHLDIVSFTTKIMTHFTALAENKQITMSFQSSLQTCYVWIDADKMEKVIFNILSNAFKYTPDEKRIKVQICDDEKSVLIRISDQGIGIPREKLGSIFNRFENLIQRNIYHIPSSGIGLSLAKELTEMHGGSISVDSEQQVGSTFSVSLRKGKSHYPPETEFILADIDETEEIQTTEIQEEQFIAENRPSILIVEDNQELRSFIKEVFKYEYRLLEASNGNEGLNKAFACFPDIIISDIMMPVMNGIEMVQALRKDERTSHIPAILLTARSDMDTVLIGIQTGADDYLTKPFSVNYLKSKVENLLARRRRLQAFYSQHHAESPSVVEDEFALLSEKDKAFLATLESIMQEEMSNPELNVDALVSHFNLSRTNFFHKLKSLTGLSPVLYIRDVRMKRAAGLVKERQYTVAEIAYKVGFSDPHYFSRTFKSFWGMNATEFAKTQD